jgi:hypothetical protein
MSGKHNAGTVPTCPERLNLLYPPYYLEINFLCMNQEVNPTAYR